MASVSLLELDDGCPTRMKLLETGLGNNTATFQRDALSLSLLSNLGCSGFFDSCSRYCRG